jgi:hypothetical protein
VKVKARQSASQSSLGLDGRVSRLNHWTRNEIKRRTSARYMAIGVLCNNEAFDLALRMYFDECAGNKTAAMYSSGRSPIPRPESAAFRSANALFVYSDVSTALSGKMPEAIVFVRAEVRQRCKMPQTCSRLAPYSDPMSNYSCRQLLSIVQADIGGGH